MGSISSCSNFSSVMRLKVVLDRGVPDVWNMASFGWRGGQHWTIRWRAQCGQVRRCVCVRMIVWPVPNWSVFECRRRIDAVGWPLICVKDRSPVVVLAVAENGSRVTVYSETRRRPWKAVVIAAQMLVSSGFEWLKVSNRLSSMFGVNGLRGACAGPSSRFIPMSTRLSRWKLEKNLGYPRLT